MSLNLVTDVVDAVSETPKGSKMNKSQIARNILQSIGANKKKPANKHWCKVALEMALEQGVEISAPVFYLQRNKMLARYKKKEIDAPKAKKTKAETKAKVKAKSGLKKPTKLVVVDKSNSFDEVFKDISTLKALAQKHGSKKFSQMVALFV